MLFGQALHLLEGPIENVVATSKIQRSGNYRSGNYACPFQNKKTLCFNQFFFGQIHWGHIEHITEIEFRRKCRKKVKKILPVLGFEPGSTG